MTAAPDIAPRELDPLGEADEAVDKGVKHNRAKVGAGRPSSLIYTYGPGAVMDLPQFTIMPAGLADWNRIWARSDGPPPTIHAPRLRAAVATLLTSRDVELRPFPWQPKKFAMSTDGNNLGVPARVFPQWLRCTGCDLLGSLRRFGYTNTHPFRSDLACFEHAKCHGKSGRGKAHRQPAVPARYLLTCVDGHLDEFPYDWWVHHGQPCAEAESPELKMIDRTAGKGASAVIACAACDLRRPMNEAQGQAGRDKLPMCRARHPHLDWFDDHGCRNDTQLILVGASNLWFAATESVIVMPSNTQEQTEDLVTQVRIALADKLAKYVDKPDMARDLLDAKGIDVTGLTDTGLSEVLAAAAAPPDSAEEQERKRAAFDPVDLLVPEWKHLLIDPLGQGHDEPSGLTVSRRDRGPNLPSPISRVLAVESLRKVNALFGFTRIDALDRVGELSTRLVPLTLTRPTWTVATEDFGEGIFLQLDEAAVAQWEARVITTPLWTAHRDAHRRNFTNRHSETAEQVDPDTRLRPPRYWLVHTLAHVLIRTLAMSCGYSAASLSERLYAWRAADGRPAAAGLLICTTASDSDGTLGGLVQQSEPDRLERTVLTALRRARRCSSDPICASRTPQAPEDFLHGAACHCCVMASETSCERANRFLDRRFLIDLPGSDVGFFTP